MKTLKCLPDLEAETGETVMAKMDEMGLPTVEDHFVMLTAEGAGVRACPLNIALFGMTRDEFVEGVNLADPAKYY